MMLRSPTRLEILRILYIGLSHVGASQYGENHAPVERDEELVAAHFPDTDGVLFSPAFVDPQGVLEGFRHGTDGPTDDATLGA